MRSPKSTRGVVGYLRPVNQWDECKVEEFNQRRMSKIANGRSRPPDPPADSRGRSCPPEHSTTSPDMVPHSMD
jgi:hypothetical protein